MRNHNLVSVRQEPARGGTARRRPRDTAALNAEMDATLADLRLELAALTNETRAQANVFKEEVIFISYFVIWLKCYLHVNLMFWYALLHCNSQDPAHFRYRTEHKHIGKLNIVAVF